MRRGRLRAFRCRVGVHRPFWTHTIDVSGWRYRPTHGTCQDCNTLSLFDPQWIGREVAAAWTEIVGGPAPSTPIENLTP